MSELYLETQEGYFCDKCGYATYTKQSYQRHLTRKTPCDTIVKPVKVDVEPTVITVEPTVITTVEPEVNIDLLNRTCKICGKEFNTIKTLRNHKSLKSCLKVKPNQSECTRCLKIFPNPSAKRSHMYRRTCKAILPPPLPQKQLKTTFKRNVSETKKKHVASLQNWRCGHCKDQLTAWFEIDHVIRLDCGGGNEIENLSALCRNCHGKKTAYENMKRGEK